MPEITSTKYRVDATWAHVPHLSPEVQAALLASTPEHMRDARTKGLPTIGAGKIFTFPEDQVRIQPFLIPAHWPGINGLDFGWDHPAAICQLRIDLDTGVHYVVAGHVGRRHTPSMMWSSTMSWSAGYPTSWPRDGMNEVQASGGEALRKQYADAGFTMTRDFAQFPPKDGKATGSVSVEAGLLLMQQMFLAGKLRVFATVDAFFPEYRTMHRKQLPSGNIVIVKVGEDFISSIRYALMMTRFARARSGRFDGGQDAPFGCLSDIIGY